MYGSHSFGFLLSIPRNAGDDKVGGLPSRSSSIRRSKKSARWSESTILLKCKAPQEITCSITASEAKM